MATYKLFVSDMDGTILHNHTTIAKETAEVVREAEQAGIHFAIATGRDYVNAKQILDQVGITCPIVSSNGGRVVNESGEALQEVNLSTEDALKVIEVLHQDHKYADVFYEMYTEGALVASRGDLIEASMANLKANGDDRSLEMYEFFKNRYYVNEDVKLVEDIEAFIREEAGRVYKFIAFSSHFEKMSALWNEIETQVRDVYVTSSGNDNIEIMAHGADKGHGVAKLAEYYGVDLSEVVVIGDNLNDLPMFKVAGKAIAMGNSHEELIAVSHHVTEKHDEYGVAKALKRIMTGEWK
ncbi:Cof-type HAD-IIB family hydrolase [Exiguobacterium algae]|uniref:Cof-type HAD-IIB family hydrolase n=1 Tax=Exiguobacterium algae TaxID=2751250 RepID=UPI001BE9A614|nr:Cof-type HAD-IIB family hydrolase [Exiguobacterium algae]